MLGKTHSSSLVLDKLIELNRLEPKEQLDYSPFIFEIRNTPYVSAEN